MTKALARRLVDPDIDPVEAAGLEFAEASCVCLELPIIEDATITVGVNARNEETMAPSSAIARGSRLNLVAIIFRPASATAKSGDVIMKMFFKVLRQHLSVAVDTRNRVNWNLYLNFALHLTKALDQTFDFACNFDLSFSLVFLDDFHMTFNLNLSDGDLQ
ncbi:hypothetical protein LZ31DRAFT_596264 [Colletotrichum somersetense]|nr:hypothetical protein LZ31DRAFT_596264 [Colletotrichum somersetense]